MLLPTSLPQGVFDMPSTCEESDSWTCAAVYRATGNETLADGATWIIGKPLAILVIFLAAVLVRGLASRMIDRVVRRAEHAPLPGSKHTYNRRAQRANAVASSRPTSVEPRITFRSRAAGCAPAAPSTRP